MTNNTVGFLLDENEGGTQRIVEYVSRRATWEQHLFRVNMSSGIGWVTIPSCCPGEHTLD